MLVELVSGSRGVISQEWNERPNTADEVLTFNSSRSTYNGQTEMDSSARKWNDSYDDFSAQYTGKV